jgi:hypothetical protein
MLCASVAELGGGGEEKGNRQELEAWSAFLGPGLCPPGGAV